MIRRRYFAIGAMVLSFAGVHAAPQQSRLPAPLSVALLIDVSASVDFRGLELPVDYSRSVASGLLPRLTSADRLGVGSFGDSVSLSGFLPGDEASRAERIRVVYKDRTVGLNGASRIWDAVDLGVSSLESEAGRRAVILLTDGEASGNRLGVADVIRHARAARVAVFVIGSGGWVDLPARGSTPRAALEALTSETGGALVLDARGDKFRRRNPGQFFERIVEALRLPN